MAETAAAADLLAGGRLQLGLSRGSPEPAWRGAEAFGYWVDPGEAREKTALFRAAIAGAGVVRADIGGRPGEAKLAVQPQSTGLADRIWSGSGSRDTPIWTGDSSAAMRMWDQVGWLDGAISRFGRSYTGEPDRIAEELASDAAVRPADTILLTVPSQLGVDYNAAMLETIAREIAPALGSTRDDVTAPVD
jgi:alkanesulfonate monooxygenase SsuD/methylene tetrahydromethanopterin reductase-like flavin-dependent oxidoreductase (luciferase family)